ncbi:MAG: TPM domain-containing protein [Bacteroidota bacterium]|nr:TPM domain-containing protein [Bacteroidota bacterium]MDP4215366.1 TPM domain-containing protein [Bacteroidota bacterium]MDP4247342.1 TPM domain-containing protein [Bacteroidota bacterium]MDP4253904.1 TPM domain-containing protein [Bacteroidota bacterium]MDP4259926.1 TPM domain-containing protein [Bacteroidota bacterium]
MYIPFLSKKKEFFTDAEKRQIVDAIQSAERQTSGQVRVFVESRCRFVDPLDRAVEVFASLKMDQTPDHNGVLVYVAIKDRQLALYGDQGIHTKVGDAFWNDKVKLILSHFDKANYAHGLVHIVIEIGEVLGKYYPYDKNAGGANDLPDDIVFGK